MNLNVSHLAGLAIIGFIVFTVYFNHKAASPSLANMNAVPETSVNHELWQGPSDGEGELLIKDRATKALLARYVLDDRGVVHESPGQAKSGKVFAEYIPNEFLGSPKTDLGAWAGPALGNKDMFQVGLRYSPIRIYNTLAIDAIASPDVFGVGGSLYLSRRQVGTPWCNIGLGVWYGTSLDGDWSGPIVGLTLSTR